MAVKRVPTLGWTRGSVAATIQLVTQQQRDDIAARVRAEMDRQGLTNSKLARNADLSEKTISRVINGRKDPRYDTLERIAKALGIQEKDLRGSPPAPLGLGMEATSQLDRIELRLNQVYELLAGGGPAADSEQAARAVDESVARIAAAAGSRRKQAPGRRANAPAVRRRTGA